MPAPMPLVEPVMRAVRRDVMEAPGSLGVDRPENARRARARDGWKVAGTAGERLAREPRERERLDVVDGDAMVRCRDHRARRELVRERAHQRAVARAATAHQDL